MFQYYARNSFACRSTTPHAMDAVRAPDKGHCAMQLRAVLCNPGNALSYGTRSLDLLRAHMSKVPCLPWLHG